MLLSKTRQVRHVHCRARLCSGAWRRVGTASFSSTPAFASTHVQLDRQRCFSAHLVQRQRLNDTVTRFSDHRTSQSDVVTNWLSFHMFRLCCLQMEESKAGAGNGERCSASPTSVTVRIWPWTYVGANQCVSCVCESWALPATLRHLSSCVSPSGRDYYSLCVKQPIGKELFHLFCQSQPDLRNCTDLLKEMVHFKSEFTEFLKSDAM